MGDLNEPTVNRKREARTPSAFLNKADQEKQDLKKVAENRRRLTVSECDPVIFTGGGKKDDDRGLLQDLRTKKISDCVDGTAGSHLVSLSFASTTDRNLKRRQSYEEKDNVIEGEGASKVNEAKKMVNSLGVGFACKKGLKPESPNQDSFSLLRVEKEYNLYGVYDGHGPAGHDVSNFIKENLVKLITSHPAGIQKDPELVLKQCFLKCQNLLETVTSDGKDFDASMSGSTVTVLYQDVKDKFFVVAHVGDSRACMCKTDGKAEVLTEDHKPNLPAEKERIEKSGGRVVFDGFYNHRIFAKGKMYPGLNMSRAMGDIVAHREAGREPSRTGLARQRERVPPPASPRASRAVDHQDPSMGLSEHSCQDARHNASTSTERAPRMASLNHWSRLLRHRTRREQS